MNTFPSMWSRRRALLCAALVCCGALVALWYGFERRWDRRLFSQREGCIFVNEGAASARSWLGDHPETIVLDVRSAREFEGGGLPGAVNVSLGVSDFGERLAGWERDRPLLVYCAGGYRSRKAVSRLQELGFTHIHHLHRGYLSWKLVSSPPKASGGRRE